MQKFFIMNYQ